MLLVSASATAC